MARWNLEDRDNLVRAMQSPFNNTPRASNISRSAKKREGGTSAILARIKQQIIECDENGFAWKTPEDWDNCFIILGGGRARRKSDKILSRMTWEDFLKEADKIIKENKGELND